MNKESPIIRVLFFILGFISILIVPWWISSIFLLGLSIYFPLYLEVLVFGFLFDTLYASRYNFPYVGLAVATILLAIVLIVRTRVRT